MEETRPYLDWKLVNDFMIDVFVKYGVPKEDAEICADVLLESDRRGIESHGCNRFKPIYLDRIKNGTLLPKTEIEILKDTPTTVVITTKRPLRVAIRVVNGVLEIENPKYPKLDVEPSTGIGLDNLRSRWHIVTGRDIEIIEDEQRFLVRLPLQRR